MACTAGDVVTVADFDGNRDEQFFDAVFFDCLSEEFFGRAFFDAFVDDGVFFGVKDVPTFTFQECVFV